jgi:hypothetical protein
MTHRRKTQQHANSGRNKARRAWGAGIWALMMAVVVVVAQLITVSGAAFSAGPDAASMFEMVEEGEGAAALDTLIEAATERGGWGPAPGDQVVFDPNMPWWTRGEVQTYDLLPADCMMVKSNLASLSSACMPVDPVRERQVRLGSSLFMNVREDGSGYPRPAYDDLLSTYIEEVGHSWQEYLYETEGRGQGPRTRKTAWEDAQRWLPGREYQIKVYLLSLDGDLLHFSEFEREMLLGAICDDDGYANPTGHQVPACGPPPDWPNPAGWPVTDPTAAELDAFCAGR